MADERTAPDVGTFLPALVVLLQNAVDSMLAPVETRAPNDDRTPLRILDVHETLINMNTLLASVLHDFRVTHASALLPDELGWWVRPRSTTWFSRFVMFEYDDERWIENFRMSKSSVINLTAILRPHIQKEDTNYRPAIPVIVEVCCCLYKLVQGASLLHCTENFAVGKSTVCEMLRDVVNAVNVELRQQIQWPKGNRLLQVMQEFQNYCSLPGVVGAIDGTHFTIRKPKLSPEDYYYFKSSGYTMQCQVVVDRHKRFLDVAVGMPGSVHDTRVLKRSALYYLATHTNHFDAAYAQEGFSPYVIGDKGYPLLPWLLTPHRNMPHANRSYADRLFNKKLRKGRFVVENAFGFLKQCFRELRVKSDLSVEFMPDVIVCCCLLHNLLLGQDVEDVERLLEILVREGLQPEVDDDPIIPPPPLGPPNMDHARGDLKRTQLGAYLAIRRAMRGP